MTEEDPDRKSARQRALDSARASRAPILEVAVRAEYVLGEALAWEYAIDGTAAAVFQEHMVWRVPVETKLKLLGEVMEAHDLADLFPFVVPVLTRLFEIRNILAHSLETPVREERHEIGYLSVRRGQMKQHRLRMDFLDWLRREGEQAFDELGLISGTIIDLRVSQAGQWASS